MEGSSVDLTTTLIIAIVGFLGVTVAPIAIALINKGGKSKNTGDGEPEFVSRAQYLALLDQNAHADEHNRWLAGELARLRDEHDRHVVTISRIQDEMSDLRAENDRLHARLADGATEGAS